MSADGGRVHRVAQLEPPTLVDAFLAEPPEGFTACAAGGAPGFIAPFDLRTTLEPAWAQRLARLPQRLLRWPVHFVGATTTEYLPFPDRDPDDFIDDVLAATPREARLVVFKDIARASPLLGARDNAACDGLLQALRARGFVLLQGLPLAWAEVGANEDAYLARLSSGRRRDIRRKLRSRAHVEVEEVHTGDARFADDACIDAFHRLYLAVHAQSEVDFDRLTRGFIARLLRDADPRGVVFVYRREGAMIGWNLCYRHGDALVDKYVGFAYPQAREANLYCVSWMHALEHARRHGLSRYIAGWTDARAKRDLGAQFTWTWNAVRPRSWLLRGVLRVARPLFEHVPA